MLIFFRGLMEAAGLFEEQEEELRGLISNKNYFGVDEFVETLNLNENLKKLFHMLGTLYTDACGLKEVKEYAAAYPRIAEAINRLEELYEVLKVYQAERYVSFELGVISDYQYYTGIIFAGYTFGSGEPIVKGGRYDRLLTYFGKNSASIGFAFVVDQLLAALSRQKIEIPLAYENELIVYEPEKRLEAIRAAQEKRAAGGRVELIAKDGKKTQEDYSATRTETGLPASPSCSVKRNYRKGLCSYGRYQVPYLCAGQREACKKDAGNVRKNRDYLRGDEG